MKTIVHHRKINLLNESYEAVMHDLQKVVNKRSSNLTNPPSFFENHKILKTVIYIFFVFTSFNSVIFLFYIILKRSSDDAIQLFCLNLHILINLQNKLIV